MRPCLAGILGSHSIQADRERLTERSTVVAVP